MTVDELVILIGAQRIEIFALQKQLAEEQRLRKEAEAKKEQANP